MLIDDLVIHQYPPERETVEAEYLCLNSCLRSLVISSGGYRDEGCRSIFRGMDAYSFLLRVSCGLESRIPGETEIFGQIKSAWREFEGQNVELVAPMRPIIQKLFSDTKSIRSKYLQGIGGSSYGTALKKILGSRLYEPVLIVGAGQLAEMILPTFKLCGELYLTNRNITRATSLKESLKQDNIKIVETLDAMTHARNVENVIFCIPEDHEHPIIREVSKRSEGTVAHLGSKDVELDVSGFINLGDIFRVQGNQSEIRRRKVQNAINACNEISKERMIYESILMNRKPDNAIGSL